MTHILQCLDVCCFGPLKHWIKILSHHWHGRPENAPKKLDQYSMMKHCAYDAIQKVFTNPEVVRSGFRKTGIYPWNKIQPDIRKLSAGRIFKNDYVSEKVFSSDEAVSALPAPTDAANAPIDDGNAPIDADTAPPTPNDDANALVHPVLIPAPVVPTNLLADDVFGHPGSDCAPQNLGLADYAEDTALAPSPTVAVPSAAAATVSAEALSRECSASSTATVSATLDAVEALVAEQKQLTHEDKQDALARFQLLMDKPRIKLFEDLYAQNIKDVANTQYQTWLMLKMQSVGTEEEAFERVLSSRLAKNVPKKKSTRKSDLPTGDDRYNPLSDAYYGYFGRVEARKGKRKVTETSPPPLVTGEPVKKVRKVKKAAGK